MHSKTLSKKKMILNFTHKWQANSTRALSKYVYIQAVEEKARDSGVQKLNEKKES